MRSLKYLNTMLTILAVLLAMQLWTLWMGFEAGRSGPGYATATPAHAAGLVNAGDQRKQMIDLLKLLVKQDNELTQLFTSGQARVRLESAPGKDR